MTKKINIKNVSILKDDELTFINIIYNKKFNYNFKLIVDDKNVKLKCESEDKEQYEIILTDSNRELDFEIKRSKKIYLNQLDYSGRNVIRRDLVELT